ncbi:MAG: segregation/condensation protein A [Patescibacteria group bacterium]
MPHIKLNQFDGPFDLLLSLINDKKLNISEIALSDVTEQFLQHLETLDEGRTETLADFLVVASRLLLLKSRLLVAEEGADEEGPTLEEQLRLYQKFLSASKELNRRWLSSLHSVPRNEPPIRPIGFSPPSNARLDLLHACMIQLVNRLTPSKRLPETRIDTAVSLKEKIAWLRSLLSTMSSASFFEILGTSKNRTDFIVSFLAVLELVKERGIVIRQSEPFSDISLTRV